jgi:hypothetical protein
MVVASQPPQSVKALKRLDPLECVIDKSLSVA